VKKVLSQTFASGGGQEARWNDLVGIDVINVQYNGSGNNLSYGLHQGSEG
jgi:hypothetical protein